MSHKSKISTDKQNGLTLIEVVIVLAILAIFAFFALPSLSQSRNTAKISRTATEIDTIRKIVEHYVRNNALVTYQNVTPANLVAQDPDAGMFWDSGGTPKNINPWDGSYNVSSTSPYSTYTITVSGIPSAYGNNFISLFQNSSASVTFNGNTLSVTFN